MPFLDQPHLLPPQYFEGGPQALGRPTYHHPQMASPVLDIPHQIQVSSQSFFNAQTGMPINNLNLNLNQLPSNLPHSIDNSSNNSLPQAPGMEGHHTRATHAGSIPEEQSQAFEASPPGLPSFHPVLISRESSDISGMTNEGPAAVDRSSGSNSSTRKSNSYRTKVYKQYMASLGKQTYSRTLNSMSILLPSCHFIDINML